MGSITRKAVITTNKWGRERKCCGFIFDFFEIRIREPQELIRTGIVCSKDAGVIHPIPPGRQVVVETHESVAVPLRHDGAGIDRATGGTELFIYFTLLAEFLSAIPTGEDKVATIGVTGPCGTAIRRRN
jgi:hypothetical protein